MICQSFYIITIQSTFTNTYFEDWWVHPNYVDIDKYKHLNRDKRCNKDIIKDLS